MANFSNVHGSAKRASYPFLKFQVGLTDFRIFGDILPKYDYWINGVKLESLSFDRDEERFTNMEKDYVNEYFPGERCKWAYTCLALDSNNQIVIVPLKKSFFEQVISTAEDLGDPTDPETGWNIVIKKTDAGTGPFGIKYELQPLKCKKTALTDEQLAVIADAKSIFEVIPRQTAEDQKAIIESRLLGREDEKDEPVSDLDADMPF